jgi:hypothetical protein
MSGEDMEVEAPASMIHVELRPQELTSMSMSFTLYVRVAESLQPSGAKLRVDNIHYDLSEGDLRVSSTICRSRRACLTFLGPVRTHRSRGQREDAV